jgi:hypothetical protein
VIEPLGDSLLALHGVFDAAKFSWDLRGCIAGLSWDPDQKNLQIKPAKSLE